jgi:hypothetical protein
MSADRLTPATLRDATQAQREIAEASEPRTASARSGCSRAPTPRWHGATARGRRLPLPTRLAHDAANEARKRSAD